MFGGEHLGFLGRIIHGTNPTAWLREYDCVWERRTSLLELPKATAQKRQTKGDW